MAAQVLDWAFGPRVGHGTVRVWSLLINVFADNNVPRVRRLSDTGTTATLWRRSIGARP
jgi:hypothetical protein